MKWSSHTFKFIHPPEPQPRLMDCNCWHLYPIAYKEKKNSKIHKLWSVIQKTQQSRKPKKRLGDTYNRFNMKTYICNQEPIDWSYSTPKGKPEKKSRVGQLHSNRSVTFFKSEIRGDIPGNQKPTFKPFQILRSLHKNGIKPDIDR